MPSVLDDSQMLIFESRHLAADDRVAAHEMLESHGCEISESTGDTIARRINPEQSSDAVRLEALGPRITRLRRFAAAGANLTNAEAFESDE